MKKMSVFVFVGVLVLILAQQLWAYNPYGYGYEELNRAKSCMDRGDFRYAYDRFYDISRRSVYDASIRKEAEYYLGFCMVKMNDPWGAIRAFENFLSRWDRSSDDTFLIPDALYVLGRTCEEVYSTDRARRYYRDCVRRFPYNEFSDKSRDRLRIIGGGYGYPNYRVNMSVDDASGAQKTNAAKALAKKSEQKKGAKYDPYLSFQLDKGRIERVNSLLKSVESMKKVDEAIKGLQKGEAGLSVVKDALGEYSQKRGFEKLHQDTK